MSGLTGAEHISIVPAIAMRSLTHIDVLLEHGGLLERERIRQLIKRLIRSRVGIGKIGMVRFLLSQVPNARDLGHPRIWGREASRDPGTPGTSPDTRMNRPTGARVMLPQMRSPAGWLGFEWNHDNVSQGVTDCVEWLPCGTRTTDVGWIPTG
jgi:hypothetical protein